MTLSQVGLYSEALSQKQTISHGSFMVGFGNKISGGGKHPSFLPTVFWGGKLYSIIHGYILQGAGGWVGELPK